ncbi:TonB-dependent receptor domain-containing protein [Kordiimonas lipolytica]|uniref:TonB-dependent receptor domain-containing protein n=1 Tax=Kordiimonas lipolytica TaxID=1662421 RepID=A0ABV8UDP8_9PROT|nr:TonB-dependent receptor [Kordiimonas lipolytica]
MYQFVKVKAGLCAGVSMFATLPAVAETVADITEISVSATKNEVEAFSVPASVSVVTREEMDDLLAASVSDLFVSVPGLSFDGGPRRTGETPTIRGVAGEGVVVLFDGVRQSFLSGHDGRFFIEPDLLGAAEVVRGGGSSLYGSGAVGGVISMRTLDAADLLSDGERAGYRLKAGFQVASNEWMTGATVFGQSADGRLDGIASLTFRQSGDIGLGDGTTLSADDEIGSGLVKASYQATDALRLSASWMGYRNDAIEPNNGQGNNEGDLMAKRVVSDTFRLGTHFNPESQLIDLQAVAYINKARVDEDDLDTDRIIGRDVETKGFTLDNRSRFALGRKANVTFTYGAEYYRDEQVGSDNMTADGTRGGVPDAVANTTGLFSQVELSLDTPVGAFYVVPGVRYDSFKNKALGETLETDESATSPKFAATWEPIENLMLFASYGEAFRAPSFNEIFADDVHFTIPLGPTLQAPNFFIPNTDLRPERSKTWEFGAGVDFADLFTGGDRLTMKGSYFTSDVTDLIDLEVNFEFSMACFVPGFPGTCNAGTSRNVNTGRATMDGFELEAVYSSPRVRLAASYSSVNGRDKDTGDYVGILSPNRLFTSAELKLPEIDAKLGTRVTLAGRFDKVDDVAEERPAYETVDVFLVWQPQGGLDGLRIDLGVDNLFDTAAERVFAGVVDAGRNAKVRVGWTGKF